MSDPSIREIIRAVSDFYGVGTREITSARRDAETTFFRHVAIFIATRITGKTLAEIGHSFGGRDHSSVWHARAKIKEIVETDDDLATTIAAIEAAVLASHRLPDWIRVTKMPDLDPETIATKILDGDEPIGSITADELIALASAVRAATAASPRMPSAERPSDQTPDPQTEEAVS